MRRRYLKSTTTLACAVLLFGAGVSQAQEQTGDEPELQEGTEETSSGSDEEQVEEGYPIDRERTVGGPTDVTNDLNNSFPKQDSVFPSVLPGKWAEIKKNTYDKTHLKLAFSYQSLYQNSSDSLGLLGKDYAWGGWYLFETRWNAVRTEKDYEGSLIFSIDGRHALGGGAVPAFYGTFEVGSLWATDIAFFEWDIAVPLFYWEQWGKKDRFVVRLGKQLAAQTYDFFRFKDARTSFTGTPWTVHTSIPSPAFGQAISFEWWPYKEGPNKEFYVMGTLNDMNGDPETVGLDTFFDDRQYFYGVEVGYFWKRKFPADFDHVHLDIFYADESAEPVVPGFPNESGWGAKLFGSKQLGRWVGFGSYTYTTVQGGGFGLTLSPNTVTAGMARLKPAGIRGEVGLALSWMDSFDDVTVPLGPLSSQFGGEAYWKILLTPDLWITPGVQFIKDPVFNPSAGFVTVGQLKFRAFF